MCKEIEVKREWTDGCSLNGERSGVVLRSVPFLIILCWQQDLRRVKTSVLSTRSVTKPACILIQLSVLFCLFTALRSVFSRWNWDSYSCFCFAFNSNTFVWQLKLLFRLQFFHTILSKRTSYLILLLWWTAGWSLSLSAEKKSPAS